MNKLFFLLLLFMSSACNDTSMQSRGDRTDTSMKSIDSSSMINNHTPLPRDSMATGVQH